MFRKNNLGLILSVILHILLLLLAFFVFDRDRYDMKEYQKTQTKGYTVQLVDAPNNQVTPGSQQTSANNAVDSTKATKEDVNFKDSSNGKSKAKTLKGANGRSKETGRTSKEKGGKYHKPAPRAEKELMPIKGQKQATKIDKRVIVEASAPIVDYTKEGSGDRIDASTDGDGTKNGIFDLRRVEYGQKVAYAIRQNIVPPPGYNGTVLPYRAYVILDENMQFVKMEVVQSTGDQQFDINIAKALRETIYPPLPSGADWRYYHNIDFTIHNND